MGTEGAALFEWHRPRSLAEASMLARQDGAVLVAGGCEVSAQLCASKQQPGSFIDLGAVQGFKPVDAHPKKGLYIGALTTIAQVSNHLWIAKRWAALHEAAEQFSSPQARNTATIIGNLCAGNPYYDMATALLALRARLQIFRTASLLTVDLNQFYTSSGIPHLAPGDIVVNISAPRPEPDAGSAFRKIPLTRRQPGDIPALCAAAYVALDPAGQIITDAAIAIGGWACVPLLSVEAGKSLRGKPADVETFEEAGRIAVGSIVAPAGGGCLGQYKRHIAPSFLRDVIEQAVSRARSKHNPFDDASDLLQERTND